jgi:UDP-glucose 4-epimerase
MKILITGGAGYIGSHVVKLLLENTNNDIVVIDNLITGFQSTIDTLQSIREFKFIQADLSNWDMIEGIFKSEDFDVIIHFASSLIVPESVENPLKYYLNNTVNTTNLVKLTTKYNIKKFIFSSTAAVYGEPSIDEVSDGIKEDFPTNPINPYGQSKLFSEKIIQDTAEISNLKYVIFRYFNVAGASPDLKIGQKTLNATHLIKALEYLDDNDSDIFNIGYSKGFSVKDVIDSMKRVSNTDFKIDMAPKRAGDPAMLISNNDKIKAKMNWIPKYNDLEMICKSAFEWERK